jgi:alpha-N-arabinofuranosidase
MMNMKCTYPFGLTRQLLLLALAMLTAFSSVPSVYGKSKPKSGKSAKGPLFSQFVYQGTMTFTRTIR